MLNGLKKTMIIAFPNLHKNSWQGGVNYIHNLLFSLKLLKTDKIKVKFISRINNYNLKKKVIYCKYLDNNFFFYRFFILLRYISLFILNKDFFLENFFKKKNIKLIFNLAFVGSSSTTKSISWIPDFQERLFPEFFSLKDRLVRRINNYFLVRHSTIIVVSSKTIYKQFIKFYGKRFITKVRVLRFVPRPLLLKANVGKIKKKLPRNFFYLPNQFWRHKNHFVVLRALNYLKKKNIDVFVVSTGHTYDRRWPNYFNSIKNYILKNKLEDNFIILGNIEKKFVNYIYFLSLAVINPSLYEGLSTSIEEAKLLNKKIILSNIATHKEQANSNCFFFNTNDYKRLAKIMLLQLNKYKNKIHVNRSYQFDQNAFGNEFVRILNSVNKM